MRGLGDLVAKGAKALGFEQRPGCGCARRQELLNRWAPFQRQRIYPAIAGGSDLWAGILASTRATTWENAGVSGGIPNRTTIFSTLGVAGQAPSFVQSVTTAQIQSAINNCPAGQIVFLNAGTYNGLTGLTLNKVGSPSSIYGDGITLRGAGADQTLLKFTGSASIDFISASIIISGGENNCCPVQNGTIQHQATAWTSGYAAGSSTITITGATTGLQVGSLIVLDQLGDTVDGWPAAGDIVVSGVAPTFSTEGSNNIHRDQRYRNSVHRVTSISGGTLTIDPPIKVTDIRSSQAPGAWWGNTTARGVGIENLSIDSTNNGGVCSIGFYNAMNSWLKGIRSIIVSTPTDVRNVRFEVCGRITVRDSYFYGPNQTANTTYGISSELASDLLIENNILQSQQSAIVQNEPETASVYGYNYFADTAAGLVAPSFVPHSAGVVMTLYEGNDATSFRSDDIHGQGQLVTQFRNFMNGGPLGDPPQAIHTYNRFFNIIGNVLGKPSSNTYQTTAGQTGSEIYALGESGANIPDANVLRTLMRWGNYDTVNAAVRFVNSEVPSGITNFPNPIPPGTNLPPSFYLSTKPNIWWGPVLSNPEPPFPPIGPDVSGGNITGYGGHVYKIPARLCFEGLSNDPAYALTPSVKLFNAASCYIGSPPPSPAVGAPQGFRAYGWSY